MDAEPNAKPSLRTRLPLWGGLLALALLFPAVVIPWLVGAFREPAFKTVDEVDVENVKGIELFVINRPDGGPDIGGAALFPVASADFDRTLALLRKATPVENESPRGVWLGRVVVTLKDGRSQSIMLHRPKNEYDVKAAHRLEIRIGSHQFEGPPVNEFTKAVGAIAGIDLPPAKPGA